MVAEGAVARAPGGVVGEAVAGAMSHAFGFTGGTLLLLIALAIGLSLSASWLSVAERVGGAILSAVNVAKLRREASATASSARPRPCVAKARSKRSACASRIWP